MRDEHSFNPEFVKASLHGARILAMSLLSDYESEEETRLLAEIFGAVKTLDKTKLYDELIPAAPVHISCSRCRVVKKTATK
jgi:hypothetical protein